LDLRRAGGWGKLHTANNGPNYLYHSPNITGVNKSRGVRQEGRMARTGEEKNAHKILVGKHEEKRPRKDLGIDGGIILNGSSRNRMRGNT